MKKFSKIAVLLVMLTVLASFFSINSFALVAEQTNAPDTDTNVADVVKDVSDDALEQIKEVTNTVVFPIIDVVLGICFFVKLGMMYFDWKKQKELNFVPIVLIGGGLLFSLTAPLYVWKLIGM